MSQSRFQSRPLLDFREAVLADDSSHVSRVPINLAVRPRDLALCVVSESVQAATLADACSGLNPALQGSICFLGQNWSDLNHEAANVLRGEIGRTLTRGAWLDGLSVLENILFPQLHHTQRPLPEILSEASALARLFGLPGIPAGRHAALMARDLQLAGCVRAFLGCPHLIVLERPVDDAEHDVIGALVNAAIRATERGSAVLWFTKRNSIRDTSIIPANRRFHVGGGEVVEELR